MPSDPRSPGRAPTPQPAVPPTSPGATRLALARVAAVQRPGLPAVPLAPRDALLLAWLAVQGPTPRNRLAHLLWPEGQDETARNSLRQRLFQLRKHLGFDVVQGQATLSLVDGVEHDLADAPQLLSDVAVQAEGELGQWLELERQRRRGLAQAALLAHADAAEQARDWPAALAVALELLALEPLSEAAHRRVMRAHYLGGDRASALQAFDRCERTLKDEVGTAPDAETLALLRTIETAGRASALPVPQRQPAAVLRPPRLVGRSTAWRAMEQAWAEGRLLLLTGDAGMGKTRLASDFAATQGAVVAGARPGDERVAYASVSRLLRALPAAELRGLPDGVRAELSRLLPELGTAPPATQGQAALARLGNAAALVLEGRAVVFDDLHFADDASLALLQAVVPLRQSRWLLATRPGEGSPAVQAQVQAWQQATEVVHLPLQPLNLDDVRELLRSLDWPGLPVDEAAPALLQRSGGNPLYLLESLKAGWSPQGVWPLQGQSWPVAPGVQALIERRISRLSLAAVQLARCAALASPDFSIELAAHVLHLRTIDLSDPWAELEAAQVLVDGAFAHDLIFEAARASVPAPVARQLHAEIAAFLAERGGEPARLAAHWVQAGRWEPAGAAWQAAALRSHQAGRALDAAALYAQAADCFEQARNPDARFDALVERGALLAEDHHGSDAVEAVDQLQALARSEAQRLRALEVRLNLASARFESAAVVAQGAQALDAARRLHQPETELRLAIVVADSLGDLQRAAEGVALLEPYADWVRAHPRDRAATEYWSALALALDYANRLHDALPVWETTRASAELTGRNDMLWKTLANAASTQSKLGFMARAAEQYGQACAQAADCGERTLRLNQTRVMWAHRLRDVGRYAQALPLMEDALAQAQRLGAVGDVAGTEHRLAQLFQQLGQPGRATGLLATERPHMPPRLQTVRLMHRADLAFELGQPAEALIREALALSPQPEDIYHRMASLFATRIVAPDEGEVLATSLAAWASARQRLGLALAAHVRAAACALRQGAAARARPHAEAALHLAVDRWPDSFYLPELWLVAGQVARALGQEEQAQAHWRTGLHWVDEVAEVPEPFRDSFRRRNPVNAELRALRRG